MPSGSKRKPRPCPDRGGGNCRGTTRNTTGSACNLHAQEIREGKEEENDDDPLWHWREYIESARPTPWWVLEQIKTNVDLKKVEVRVIHEINQMEEVLEQRRIQEVKVEVEDQSSSVEDQPAVQDQEVLQQDIEVQVPQEKRTNGDRRKYRRQKLKEMSGGQ